MPGEPLGGQMPVQWPTFDDAAARLRWYAHVVEAYADMWADHSSAPVISPVAAAELDALEVRLAVRLPTALRRYHEQIGVLSLAETLCSATAGPAPIQALRNAYPGVGDIVADDSAVIDLIDQLIVFGDYLGNGNMFCFHRDTAEVYYFDHDGDALLTRFADSITDYLDALMLVSLAEVHDVPDATVEALLAQRLGRDLIHLWRY